MRLNGFEPVEHVVAHLQVRLGVLPITPHRRPPGDVPRRVRSGTRSFSHGTRKTQGYLDHVLHTTCMGSGIRVAQKPRRLLFAGQLAGHMLGRHAQASPWILSAPRFRVQRRSTNKTACNRQVRPAHYMARKKPTARTPSQLFSMSSRIRCAIDAECGLLRPVPDRGLASTVSPIATTRGLICRL